MRILFLCSSLPYPAQGGGALRTLGIVRGLAEAGHDVHLLCFHDNTIAVEATPFAAWGIQVTTVTPPERGMADRLRALALSAQPDIAGRLESAEFRTQLARLLSSTAFDIVQFQGLEMAIYLAQVRRQQPKARLVYDAFNAEYVLQRRIAEVDRDNLRRLPAAVYSRIQAQRLYHFERTICAAADAVIAVSPEDAEALKPLRPDGQIHLLPNGIYVDDYVIPRQTLDLGQHALVFTGKMDYRPNVDAMLWFTQSVLPGIIERRPDVKLYIVGQKPHGSLQALSENRHVEITGWVPEVQPFLHSAAVYVAPLRMGAGTRLKILEAMASACAVVATSVAAAGLVQEAQQALVLADSEQAFSDAVVRLLENPSERDTQGQAAQEAVRHHYDWSALLPCLLKIHQDIAGG